MGVSTHACSLKEGGRGDLNLTFHMNEILWSTAASAQWRGVVFGIGSKQVRRCAKCYNQSHSIKPFATARRCCMDGVRTRARAVQVDVGWDWGGDDQGQGMPVVKE